MDQPTTETTAQIDGVVVTGIYPSSVDYVLDGGNGIGDEQISAKVDVAGTSKLVAVVDIKLARTVRYSVN